MTSLLGDLQEGVGVGVAASKPLAMTAWAPELRAPGPIRKATWRAKRRSSGAGPGAVSSRFKGTVLKKKWRHLMMTTSGLNMYTHTHSLWKKKSTTNSSLRS